MVNCKWCKIEFESRNRLHKFCNKKCQRKYEYYSNREENIKKSRDYEIKNFKPKIVNKICPDCNKEFTKKNNCQKFCSRRCCIHFFNNLNPEHKKVIIKEWRLKNIEHFRELSRNRMRKRMKEDINFRIANLMRSRIYGIIRTMITTQEYRKLKTNISYRKVAEHLINILPKDFNERKYHIDHIKPLCSFNLKDQKQFEEAFSVENHRWLLAEDNLKKGKIDKLKSIKYGASNE